MKLTKEYIAKYYYKDDIYILKFWNFKKSGITGLKFKKYASKLRTKEMVFKIS